ncbi:MAG: malto-oligosyltrehalose synthase [Terriglobales bacterium]
MTQSSIPLSTYRLQFNQDFTFTQAMELVPYLAALGISHCYASPFLKARPGSTHGYDIIDHNQLNPEIGTDEDFEKFVATLHEHGMGQILDVVPNHMGVMGSDNEWWLDVLENGEASDYADFFDIDWNPLKDELQGKLLVPILGDQYGAVLDNGELKLAFDKEKGEFSVFYHEHKFPVNPREYPRILGRGLDRLERALAPKREEFLELQSLIAGFSHLPTRSETSPNQREERLRDKQIHKRRLAALCAQSVETSEFIEQNVCEMNGTPGDSKSFDELHELIKAQAYRLSYWRVAADDINYRRFFDINDLAGLRMENAAVFEITHRFVLDLVRQGKVNGLRIDHPDGLYDPAQYFRRLQQGFRIESEAASRDSRRVYVIIEKILTGEEQLPREWPVDGTTGYDFLNQVNGLFVDAASVGKMDRIYRMFIGVRVNFDTLVYRSKKIVMHTALASELNVLANALRGIALANRHTCDFTLNSLRDAFSRIVACFPVYRTYISGTNVSETDQRYILEAVECAKRQSPGSDTSVFDFVQDALLLTKADTQGKLYRDATVRFAMKAQQFSSAVMAKGLEDTSFYRYHRLDSLNEVGGDPRNFGESPEAFHAKMSERAKLWPHTMLDTSTHDTKRSEDVRSRINVLSEIPARWGKALRHWRELNHGKKQLLDDVRAPSRNDEYLLYQTLVGVWPLEASDASEANFRDRIKQYMVKAVREAKEKSSWANPNANYESAVTSFVDAILSSAGGNNEFLKSFAEFQQFVAAPGMLNSLSQTLLKLTCPGVPDFYQGTELWDLSMVDPDNRRPVDYTQRARLLKEMESWPQSGEGLKACLRDLMSHAKDGRIKMYLIWKALSLRKQRPELFQQGSYLPLVVEGNNAGRLLAFSRRHEDDEVMVVVPRLCAGLFQDQGGFPVGEAWKETRVMLPPAGEPREYRNVLTAECVNPSGEQKDFLEVRNLLADFPVALMLAQPSSAAKSWSPQAT